MQFRNLQALYIYIYKVKVVYLKMAIEVYNAFRR
jgi:hypothetical protein